MYQLRAKTSRMPHFVVMLCFLLLTGCNIFSPFHEPGKSDDVDDLLSDATAALDEGKYRKALIFMDKAMLIEPDDARVRYLHAVVTVKARNINLLEIIRVFQPADDEIVLGMESESILLMSNDNLTNLFDAFNVICADLEPLVERMVTSGHELRDIRQSGDVFLSHGIAETLIGMLRVLDNDDTPGEFSLDDRLAIEKAETGYFIRIQDELLNGAERDRVIDEALDSSWHHFVSGRASFFLYYQFAVERSVWSDRIQDPPSAFPTAIDEASVIGEMAAYVDDGVLALFDEKEDR